jgi:lipoprotein-releasing system permease protein
MGLFVLEGTFIGLLGAIVGGFISWLLIMWIGRTGIDLSAIYGDLSDYGELYALMGTHLYPAISGTAIILYGFAAAIIGALAALFPAWRASQREPAESLHYI